MEAKSIAQVAAEAGVKTEHIQAIRYVTIRALELEHQIRAGELSPNLAARLASLRPTTREKVMEVIDERIEVALVDFYGADEDGAALYYESDERCALQDLVSDLVPSLKTALESGDDDWVDRIEIKNALNERLRRYLRDGIGKPQGHGLPDWLLMAIDSDPGPEHEAFYGACSIKTESGRRKRRKKVEMNHLRALIFRITQDIQPATDRQVFYQLVVAGAIEKSEDQYNKVVVRLLSEMRRAGWMPFHRLTDNTRLMRKPHTSISIRDEIRRTAEFYRQQVWRDLPVYVEIWIEKAALSGVVYEATSLYDAPLMVARGFSSLTFLNSAAEHIAELGKPAFIYHLGDHDPSGGVAATDIERKLREFAPFSEIHFERLAVLPEQIEKWKLPTRPTKREKNMHAKKFVGDSVELDAVHPETLRQLVRDAIERHIPAGYLDTIEAAEKSERELGLKISDAADYAITYNGGVYIPSALVPPDSAGAAK